MIIWVNYNHLTVLPNPGIMVNIWEIIPKWPQDSGWWNIIIYPDSWKMSIDIQYLVGDVHDGPLRNFPCPGLRFEEASWMGGKIRGIGIPIAMWLLGFFKDVGRTCNYSRTISHTIHTHTIYICMYTCVCADDDMYYIYIDYIWV